MTEQTHTHYEHLCSFVQKQIQLVAAEQEIKDPSSGFTNNIDRLVILWKKALIYKTCYNCQYEEVPRSKHTCPR